MYKAFITPLTAIRPHPNADRLRLATCLGSQVVIGLDNTEGEVGVFFPEGGQLSHEMCLHNGLYNMGARVALGLTSPEPRVGFFDKNRRVRAQTFRGAKSEGIWLPLTSLDWFPGVVANEFEEPAIAIKYITPSTRRGGTQSQRSTKRGETVMFKKHVDTDQFAYYADQIPAGSLITITEKLHGTSGRLGRVLEPKPTRWYHRLLKTAPGASWQVLNGTRNVIIEHSSGVGFYGNEGFRYEVIADLIPRKGETLYFELVGFAGAQEIMPSQAIPADLKELKATYGERMHFHYGCPPGQTRLYVYRITQTNEDGQSVELSWPQVKARCGELGIAHVPELCGQFFYDGCQGSLQEIVDAWTVGPSTLDASQIREGCALRIDTPDGRTYWLKSKSFEFKVLEGIIKLDDTYVDTEEAA